MPPKLSKEQISRLRRHLMDCERFASPSQARKATANYFKCREQVLLLTVDPIPDELADITDLYIAADFLASH